MKNKSIIRSILTILARSFRFITGRRAPTAPPQQLDLGLDRVTASGLPLREALSVRSAEFWVALGEPRLALKELENLNEIARQNDWTQRVQLTAVNNSNPIAA